MKARSVAIVLFNARGQLACVHHAVRGAPELPGGKVEPGETPENAAYRELSEELGVSRKQVMMWPLCRRYAGPHFCQFYVAVRVAPRVRIRGSREGRAVWLSRARLLRDGTFREATAHALQVFDRQSSSPPPANTKSRR